MRSLEQLQSWAETLPQAVRDTLAGTPRMTVRPAAAAAGSAPTVAESVVAPVTGRLPVATPSVQLASLQVGPIIARGGMGQVSAGRQMRLGREVAIKAVRDDRADVEHEAELVREARVTGRLEHPNIVPVHDIAYGSRGQPQVILKRIVGVGWDTCIADAEQARVRFGVVDLRAWNLEVFLTVANALRFAHSHGVIHRDIKPGNVMLGAFGEVYLLDWGLAASIVDEPVDLVHVRDLQGLSGTPAYMAPEMLGDDAQGLATDVYLLGAVLYELMVGHPPHVGDSMMELIVAIATSAPRYPEDAPAGLVAICQRAMAPRPADRFPSVEALCDAVEAYRRDAAIAPLLARGEAALTALQATSAQAPREQVLTAYRLCRDAFNDALVMSPNHPAARDGLDAATVATVLCELTFGEPAAAQLLLAHLTHVPPELRLRVDAELARARARQTTLEALRQQHDAHAGIRTRLTVGAIISTMFVTTPLVTQALHSRGTHPLHVAAASALVIVIVALLKWWSRHTMESTHVNRRIGDYALFLGVPQTALWVGLWQLGIPVVQGYILTMALWFALAGAACIALDERLLPTAIAYLAAFLLAAAHPPWVFWLAFVSNAVLMANIVYMWRRGMYLGPPRPSHETGASR